MKRVEVRTEGGVMVIGVPAVDRRIDELSQKPNRSQGETLELILLRQERIETLLRAAQIRQGD